MTAEEQLREYANKVGVSMRVLRDAVHAYYTESAELKKADAARVQAEMNYKQLTASNLAISVNGLELELRRIKLVRVMRWINRWNRIKSFFKPKTKTNE